MRTQSTRADGRFHMHCVLPPGFHRGIRQVALDEGLTISDLVYEILKPEIDRRLKQLGREIANPK